MSKRLTNQAPADSTQKDEENNRPESGAPVVKLVDAVVNDDADPQNSTQAGAQVGDAQQGAQLSQHENTSNDPVNLPDNGDPEAPFGRRSDGSPAMKRGPKPKSVSDESDKQRQKLRSVTASTRRVKPEIRPGEGLSAVQPLAVVNYMAMGQTAASMFFAGGTMLLGDEWEPNKEEGEHTAIAGAFSTYFRSVNARDLPPAFALVFALSLYSIKRAGKPTIKTKLQKFGLWCKEHIRMPRLPRFGAGTVV